ncbi:ImmA/IrrE family metallo-endopeptidase [Nocardia brasiliensis]|uniref:ImmA/IrrE family metallo-endopeptidase n=1 Tax=Nocardia brasiliensis TaxID=37326 RepID=UPI0018933D04|nr:ImmA/IrrE family metallo-endopeptidase [Nocardia brasiliensis]MBF6127837.1 ImmA/IrrE family metallo-endopeptidase [Nocardia brasiliensis]
MVSWRVANTVAAIAAAQALGDLEVDPRRTPIQIAPAISQCELPLIWRPLPRLFGVYLDNPGQDRGILVNNGLTRAVRRHTAAHELGHHRLGHETTLDFGLDADPVHDRADDPRQSSKEKAAEAFAAWFLMPRRGVLTTMRELGLPRITAAAQVYQLALHLGTSYAATVRHLATLRLISATEERAWSKIAPATFKRAMTGDLLDTTRDVDTWHLGRGHRRVLYTSPGDLLIVPAPQEITRIEGAVNPIEQTPAGAAVLRCGTPDEDSDPARIYTASGAITVVVEPRPYGLDRSGIAFAAQTESTQ